MIRHFLLLSFFLIFGFALGQTKAELQKQSADLKKQISQINAELAKSQNESKLSVAYLANVNKKIQLREKVVSNTQKEKQLIEDDIYHKQLEINRRRRDLEALRKNYQKVLVNAYKNRDLKNKVTFILSSRSFGEAIRRAQYLRFYSAYQERQAAKIMNASAQLKNTVTSRQKSVGEKQNLLASQQKDLNTIAAERAAKEKLLQEFKQNESKLTAELSQKRAQQKALEGQIRSIIAEELRIAKAQEEIRKKAEAEKIRLAKEAAAREKARIDAANKAREEALARQRAAAEAEAKKAAELLAKKAEEERRRADDAAKAEATAREIARRDAAAKEAAEAAEKSRIANEKLAQAKAAAADLEKKKEAEKKVADTKAMASYGVATSTSDFAAARGRLSMPAYGTVTHRFGRQPHPVFKNIMEENNGIKISVARGTAVKCVYPGVVSSIIPAGDGTRTVVVRHGEYFTIYANLSATSVSKNQQISAGTPVGTVGEDFDGSYTLDFQIWKGDTPVDPMGWLG